MPASALPLYLHGVGHFHPDTVIDNRFLEELDIGTSAEWILERVGIRQRRTVLPLDYIRATKNQDLRASDEAALVSTVESGRRAADIALRRAGIEAKDVGLVIAGGCTPDGQTPAEACRIAGALGIEAPAFDLSSACSSFGAQLHFLSRLLGLPEYVLTVNVEHTTRVVDYRDRATAVLWGDGSSAAVVSRAVPSRLQIVDTSFASLPSGSENVRIPRFGHFRQEGSTVQRFAIKTTLECILRHREVARARATATGGRVRFIGHQANLLMLDSAARRAGVSDGHWFNVDEFGNTGAAGAPSVLSQHWEEIGDADTLIVAVVGAGLSWSSLRVEASA